MLLPSAAAARDDPRIAADGGSVELPMRQDGTLHHVASGYAFPARLGAFQVRKKWIIAADDVMVDYADHGAAAGEPWLSVYVFRRPFGLDAEIADEIERPLIDGWSATPLDSQPVIAHLPADVRTRWYSGTKGGRTYTTGYAVVLRNGWFIEVRAGAPSTAGKAWLDAMFDAVGRIDWNGVIGTAASRNAGSYVFTAMAAARLIPAAIWSAP